eukprot:scaffold24326_cov79-Skeletonema_dohrnii-CCMP3373.AAC.4
MPCVALLRVRGRLLSCCRLEDEGWLRLLPCCPLEDEEGGRLWLLSCCCCRLEDEEGGRLRLLSCCCCRLEDEEGGRLRLLSCCPLEEGGRLPRAFEQLRLRVVPPRLRLLPRYSEEELFVGLLEVLELEEWFAMIVIYDGKLLHLSTPTAQRIDLSSAMNVR